MKKILLLLVLAAVIISVFLLIRNPEPMRWKMPKELDEISGLCYLHDDLFACVQDEHGTIFLYDTGSSHITKKIRFAGKGDYEGIAVKGDTAFVITGDGYLYEVRNFMTDPVVYIDTLDLRRNEESEAICYDRENDRLLLAFKEHKKDKIKPGIFIFNIAGRALLEKPLLRINIREDQFKKLDEDNLRTAWEPADICLDPRGTKIYVVDAINEHLIVMDRDGEVQKVISLDSKLFPHPEGITIDGAGNIYICNDGNKEGKGSIVLYENVKSL